jgi:dihydrolipoamide dehydrogenase
MSDRHVDVLIIGGGPGGYVTGIRAGQLGLDALVVDAGPLGGTCLNVGCIPSKALIHAADEFITAKTQATAAPHGISVADPRVDLRRLVGWKDGIVGQLNRGVAGLLAKAGTAVVEGRATVVDGKTVEVRTAEGPGQRISTDHLVIASGSEPVALPGLPFGERVLSSTEVLDLTELPERLAVVGGGYIGLELGMALAKLGTAVTVVEAEDRILSQYDGPLTAPVTAALTELGVTVLTSARARELTAEGLVVEEGHGTVTVAADRVLVTVGRRPRVAGMGLSHLGLTMSGPFIAVDERGATSMRNVWAVGDVTGEPMLAHRAMKQGEVVAEAIAGRPTEFRPEAIPAVVFTDPEIVTVGVDPATAQAAGIEVVVGRFPLAANARSMTLGHDGGRGFVRAVARADDHLLLGLQAVGTGVAELAAAFGLALEMGARLEDVADTIHAHPTVGEGLAEACLAALGHALHA